MSADGEVEISLVSTESSEEGSSILTAGSCDKDSDSYIFMDNDTFNQIEVSN